MAAKKHWLDWSAVAISLLSLTVAGLTAYQTLFLQRDDIRLVVGHALMTVRDDSGILLDQVQDFTFINSGNRQAVISGIYAELVLQINPKAKCNNRLAKSIILTHTPLILKPGDILPVRANVVERYPWEKDNEKNDETDGSDRLRFRQSKEEKGASYLVCLQVYVTTPDSSSTTWMAPLYSVTPTDPLPSPLFDEGRPLIVVQQMRLGFGG